jgi:hypothetical protein
MPQGVCQRSFVLTVAESKRLIARALKRHPAVITALSNGIVAVAKGTTNAYVVEELAERGIHRPDYCTGVTKPQNPPEGARTSADLPDLVLRCGVPVEGVSVTEIVAEMGPGDVFIKGANALSYERGQAAVLIGHPTGGTVGAVLGALTGRRITLLIPVGLEKHVPGDLVEAATELMTVGDSGSGPTLWPLHGEIFTELEAVTLISGARARLIGAGGIGGAEGSIRISVTGVGDQVDRAQGCIEDVWGELPFIDA